MLVACARLLAVAASLAALCWLSGVTPALAATIQVTTAVDESGSGAACSLREAVAAVNAGSNGTGGCVATGAYGTNDAIMFTAGTDGTPVLLTNGVITILHSVQITGNSAASTIIDGQKGTASATSVLKVDSGTVGISGLTIRNGSATDGGGINNGGILTVGNSTFSGNAAILDGGAIYNGATLTVTNSIFSGNSANAGGGINNGGGINIGATLTVMNSIFSGNAANAGGGILNDGGTVTVGNSTFSGNVASSGGNNRGGGIYNLRGTMTVTNSTLSSNSAAASGGGINNSGTMTVTDSTLSGNSGFRGGGINNENNGTLTIANSTLSGNSSSGNGGGITSSNRLTVTNSTLSGNSANAGGGILVFNGTATVLGSMLSGNSADQGGGGISIIVGTLTVTNSTLSGNSAPNLGGGILVFGGTVAVTNSTLSGNSAPDGGGIDNDGGTVSLRATLLDTGVSGANCAGSVASLGSNVADDTSCGLAGTGDQQIANGAILVGPLANNGGPTQTHALLVGSPALDAVQGACTLTGQANSASITTDQRGQSRPAGARCDAGAYERSLGTLGLGAATFSVGEGDGNATITVTRTGGSEGSVGATVSTANGTALAPSDYTATTSTVSFADGEAASKTISVVIVDDALKEPNETVALTLGSPTGGAAIGAQSLALLTIFDNDPTPFVSVANVSVAEGNAGPTSATFSAVLSNPSGQQITVAYATTNGTASFGSDYTATSGTLTFAPGVTSQPIAVPVLGDTLFEPDETFTVTLSIPTNATLGTAQAIGTITNDDVVVACSPRPNVTSTLAVGGGELAVHVEATPLNTQTNNFLQRLQFSVLDNATVTLNGQSIASGQTVTFPPNTVVTDFTIRRTVAGQAATVFLTVVDGCGSWRTFVGGGTAAGF